MAMSCSSNCMVKFDPLITRAYMWSMTERPCTWGSAPSFFDIRVDMRNITPVSGTQPAVVGSVAICFGVSYPWCRFGERNFVLPSTTPSQFDPVAFANSIDVLESYKPRYMYLTHFGRLDYAPQTAALLRRQVQDYCGMARDYGDDAERLQSKLSEYSLALLRDIGDGESAVSWPEALAFDLQLNAQGLLAWLRSDRLTRA